MKYIKFKFKFKFKFRKEIQTVVFLPDVAPGEFIKNSGVVTV